MSTEVADILLSEEHKELQKAATRVKRSKGEKAIIFNAHSIAEKLVSDMIATRLVQPGAWLKDADYPSKIKLAKALGLIGQKEYSICSVLASAKSALTKSSISLPQKWKSKILSIAYGYFKIEAPKTGPHKPFDEVVRVLLAILSARWLEERLKVKINKIRRRHSQRWSKLMKSTLWANLELLALDPDSPENRDAIGQVDLQLVTQLRAEKKL